MLRIRGRIFRLAMICLTPAVMALNGAGSLAATPTAARSAPKASTAPVPQFAVPTIVGIQGNGFEHDVRVDSRDPQNPIMYTSSPDGAPVGSSFVWRSFDGGRTFKWVPAATALNGRLPECPAGGAGDTELAVDSAGNLYFNDLNTLVNFNTMRSADQGTTFATTPSCAGVPVSPVDRQWYATEGNPTDGTGNGRIYLTYDQVAGNTVTCTNNNLNTQPNVLVMNRSPLPADPPGPASQAGIIFGPTKIITPPVTTAGTTTPSCDEGIMGNDEVSPRKRDGNSQIFVVHDNNGFDEIRMGRCEAVPFTTDPTGLTCDDKLVYKFPLNLDGTDKFVTGANFPTMAVDSAGTLYALWEQAPCGPCLYPTAVITGDTRLYLSQSLDDGLTWTAPQLLPNLTNDGKTLHQTIFGWVAAGSAGKFDIGFYGTDGAPDYLTQTHGPSSTPGDWGVYLLQSLDGGATFSGPTLASEHSVHHGTVNVLFGGSSGPQMPNGNRALGDFMQVRIGPQGEANISYADTNHLGGGIMLSHAMYVRQNGGPGVLDSVSTVNGAAKPVNAVADACGDATFDASGISSPSQDNLDILSSSMALAPDQQHYRIRMVVRDLRNLAPSATAGGIWTQWMTQWVVPDSTNADGGHVYHAEMTSNNGAAPTFWDGQNRQQNLAQGNGDFTYPGEHQLAQAPGGTGYTATAPGVITIDVPLADVPTPVAQPLLYSVTAATTDLPSDPNLIPSDPASQALALGGQLFNLLDAAAPYTFDPAAATVEPALPSCLPGPQVPEVPWVPALLAGAVIGALGVRTLKVLTRREATGVS